jgi:hypothetical protein
LRQATALYAELAAKSPDNSYYRRQWATVLHDLATQEKAMGEKTTADDHEKEAIELLQTLIKRDPNDAESTEELKKLQAAPGTHAAAL